MTTSRKSGLLLHPTSLPSRWGIGDLGPAAYQFVDLLVAAGQQIWQVLPLGPTGYGDSPYQCFSSFAGNPLLVSPDLLMVEGLLAEEDIADLPPFPNDHVDFGWVIPYKTQLLQRSFARFQANASADMQAAFAHFRTEQQAWLNDYALFAALKQANNGAVWSSWDAPLARHEPQAVWLAAEQMQQEVSFQAYVQFLFFRHWMALKQYANHRGLTIVGDVPIFTAYDSADVWASQQLFFLDDAGQPTVVAGVPPDYFSETGQRWGNPLYRWDRHAQEGFQWWIARVRAVLTMVDLVRIDHFRGFAGYWEVPASEPTAVKGRWVAGPGPALFEAIQQALGAMPIIAEDLGVITPDVVALRDGFGFPGMKILQFAFSSTPADAFLPHNYPRNCVVYTGTHDNDTTLGWWQAATPDERRMVQRYFSAPISDVTVSWEFIRAVMGSVADTAVVPLQDVLALDTTARMNYPGRPAGNWSWRFAFEQITPALIEHLHDLAFIYGRLPAPPAATDAEDAA